MSQRNQVRSARTVTRLILAVVILSTVVSPAFAASSTAGDATPNFTESSSCGPYGIRGPLSAGTTIGDRIYGPFADFFGRSRTTVGASVVTWTEPSGFQFRVHNRALAAFNQAAANIVSSGVNYQVNADAAWVWRNIGGSTQMSQHAVGSALDINPRQNPFTSGALITDMPPAYREAWKAAGFCWGGDWRFTKDAMHYSWKGPAALAGLTPRQAPYPALTAEAAFTTKALDVPVAVEASGLYALSDRRRDGADDLYGLVDVAGKWQVQIAGAVARFGKLGVRWNSEVPTSGTHLLADANGDGRADLWRFNSTGSVTADVYFDGSRFRTVGNTVTTGATWHPDTELGLALYDMSDWVPDLYVFRRNAGTVEIYSSSSGYQTLVHSSSLGVAIGSRQIVLADRDGDGVSDIWLVGSGNSPTVEVFLGSNGYGGAPVIVSTAMSVPDGSSVLPGDYDGDGRVDLYVVSSGRIAVWLGGVPDRAVSALGDWFTPSGPNTFDAGPVCMGDCDEIGYVDRSGSWRLAHEVAWATDETNFFYGVPGDTPFMGDWDCDGVDTPGLYRRSDGYAYIRNSNTEGVADLRFYFGIPGDIPIVGDWDGDQCDTISIYRPSEQRFYITNRLGSDDLGFVADFSFVFGNPGDKPFSGDFDGNGQDEVGLHRETTGRVYLRFTLTTGVADLDFIYGDPGDFLVAGDWDGDGVDTPAIFRPSDGNWYLRLSNTHGVADHVIPFGLADRGFLPVAGDNRLLGSLGILSVGGASSEGDLLPEEND